VCTCVGEMACEFLASESEREVGRRSGKAKGKSKCGAKGWGRIGERGSGSVRRDVWGEVFWLRGVSRGVCVESESESECDKWEGIREK
jgi:hypothetical protein